MSKQQNLSTIVFDSPYSILRATNPITWSKIHANLVGHSL